MSRADALRKWAEANGYGNGAQARTEPARRPQRAQTSASIDVPTVLDIETTGSTPWTGDLLCVGIGDTAYDGAAGRRAARKLLAGPGVVVCHTGYDLRWLALDGAKLHRELKFHDTRVMAWLLTEEGPLGLDDLCVRWLDYLPPKPIKVQAGRVMFESETEGLVPIEEAPRDELLAYNESDLDATARLYARLRDELQYEGLWDLFLADEVPLVRTILDMEVRGLPFNEENRVKLRERVQHERDELGEKLLRVAKLPPSFNLGSSKQVSEYLFGKGPVALDDRVELSPAAIALAKRAKSEGADVVETLNASRQLPKGFVAERVGRLYAHGFWSVQGRDLVPAEAGFGSSSHWKDSVKERERPSTSSISLVLKNPHDAWVADFVLWRELSKLDNAFLAKFPLYVHGGRLHGTTNRAGTATGRFSSAAPNLQQIPAHGAYGAHVRALFEGPLVIGDYSQLEQRVAAHFCQDENLLKAYTENIDLYGLAASMLFGGEPSKEHPQRGLMKTGMLALQYGAGAGKLAQLMLIDGHLDATRDGAEELIEQLRSVFPTFFAWREEVIEEAVVAGFLTSLGGRRRRLAFPDEWSRLRRRGGRRFPGLTQDQVSAGFAMERQAVNFVCQGGAADIVARAMVKSEQIGEDVVRVLVQVHDEILWERGPDWEARDIDAVRYACEVEHGFELNVPLVFDAKEVGSWAEKGGGVTNMSNLFSERMKRNRSEGLQSRKAADLARQRATS